MDSFTCFPNFTWKKFKVFHPSFGEMLSAVTHFILSRLNSFWIELSYFIILSCLGYFTLLMFHTRSVTPSSLDLLFTSVSASTTSSMSAVEMEVFSNGQLVMLTIMMLLGGKVFTSMLGLQFVRYSKFTQFMDPSDNVQSLNGLSTDIENNIDGNIDLKYKSKNYLCYVVLAYHFVVNFLGSVLVFIYFSFFSTSAKDLLKKKGIRLLTFSVFTTISTFSNCGFLPTNENMLVFRNNSGLLLILIPQILLGNTLYPTCLRGFIWVLKRLSKRKEYKYMLKNSKEMGYEPLVSSFYSSCICVTEVGFVVAQFVMFCTIEWYNLEAMDGLSGTKEKLAASLFQVVNARHSGENVVDLSVLSPAILVIFVVMMYLPSSTCFSPGSKMEHKESPEKEKGTWVRELIFSQLSYLAISVIMICITERQKIKDDPLNFSVFNIIFEVISAYGNVGLSTGYSCNRRLKTENFCESKMYGFVGAWSNEGKIVLMIVMLFGRLKKFSTEGGSAWISL